MNKVNIESDRDGTVNLTLPNGGQSPSLSPKEAAKRLKGKVEEFQRAIDDMKARREELENS
jgi:hypothetical protein